MLVYLVAAFAAVQAPAPAGVAPATAQPVVPAPAPTIKPKKKRVCDNEEAEVGSHIVTCSTKDDYERLREAHQAEQSLQYSGVAVEKSAGPH